MPSALMSLGVGRDIVVAIYLVSLLVESCYHFPNLWLSTFPLLNDFHVWLTLSM